MVIAPAKTGRDSKSNIAVIKMDHTNRGNRLKFMEESRIFRIVVIKLIAPKIEETPAICKLKMASSMEKS